MVRTRPSQVLTASTSNYLRCFSKTHMHSLFPTSNSSARISKDGARGQGLGESVLGTLDAWLFLNPNWPHQDGRISSA